MRRNPVPFLLVLLALGACGDDASRPADVLPESQLTFLRLAPNAPPLERDSVAFWAVVGEGRGVEIRFAPPSGSDDSDGEEFLRFEVPGDALLRRPDGTAFQRGDSVRISIIVAEPRELRFRFRPEGLTFRADNPAELRVSFARADDDYDGDGDQDGEDERVAQLFAVWHQTRDGEPWTRMGTVREADFERVRAQITSFSQYALAGGN